MSMHKIPLTQLEEDGLRAHGLDIGSPSQLSDVFRQGIKWALEQTAPQPMLAIPDECPHIIVFDDADRENEMFAGCGARPAAMRRWEQISQSWNAHLFVRIEKNSRDAPYPCATAAPQPEQSGLIEKIDDTLATSSDGPLSDLLRECRAALSAQGSE